MHVRKARLFLLVDLWGFFFQIKGQGDGKKKEKKSSENDQFTGHFQSFFFLFIFRAFFLNISRTNS